MHSRRDSTHCCEGRLPVSPRPPAAQIAPRSFAECQPLSSTPNPNATHWPRPGLRHLQQVAPRVSPDANPCPQPPKPQHSGRALGPATCSRLRQVYVAMLSRWARMATLRPLSAAYLTHLCGEGRGRVCFVRSKGQVRWQNRHMCGGLDSPLALSFCLEHKCPCTGTHAPHAVGDQTRSRTPPGMQIRKQSARHARAHFDSRSLYFWMLAGVMSWQLQFSSLGQVFLVALLGCVDVFVWVGMGQI